MNSLSHAILNLSVLGRREIPNYHGVIFLGAFIGDIALYIGLLGVPVEMLGNVLNSFFVSIVGLGLFYFLKITWAKMFFLSLLLHQIVDFAWHGDAHLWPVSDWVFNFSIPGLFWIEFGIVLVAVIWLYHKLSTSWASFFLIMATIIHIIGFIAWYLFA